MNGCQFPRNVTTTTKSFSLRSSSRFLLGRVTFSSLWHRQATRTKMRKPGPLLVIHFLFCLVPSRSFRLSSFLCKASSSPVPTIHETSTTRRMASSSPSPSATTSTGNLVISLRQAFVNKQVALILASQSPRRREILDMMGLAGLYETIPSPLDETALQTELAQKGITKDPQRYTQILAEEKARATAESLTDVSCPTLVLGSDTIVDQDEAILEKPVDVADAQRMLRQLSGRVHYVHTGVALYRCVPGAAKPEKILSFVDQATVQFTALDEADIQAYVAAGEPMDKAGSYGIQGMGGQFVSSVQGDFFTVMGLPMHRTSSAIADVVKQTLQDSKGK